MLFGVVMCVEIQLMTVGCEHLSNSVFVKHTLVHIQLVAEYLLIDLIFKKLVFIEGMADKQTGMVSINIKNVKKDIEKI